MRIEVHYFADDDTEFDTREECEAYERSLREDFDSVIFFDKDWNIMRPKANSIDGIAESAMYMKILDGENAARLIKWIDDFCGVCCDGLDDLITGEIYAWDNDDFKWFSPLKKLRELQKTVDAVEKAVNGMG